MDPRVRPVVDEVQALLREIQGDSQIGTQDTCGLEPYSNRQMFSTSLEPRSETQQPKQKISTQCHSQRLEARDLQILQTNRCVGPDFPFDAYDRALLADEPHPARHWQATYRTTPLPLPPNGLQAQDKKISHFVRGKSGQRQVSRSEGLSIHQHQEADPCTQYLRGSAPDVGTSSSPSSHVPSSPSFGPSQRRTAHGSLANKLDESLSLPISQVHPFAKQQVRAQPKRIDLGHAPPVVQGIQLVSLNELPDRFRSIFGFHLFNAVQSKCYEAVYKSNDNLVLSAPTGSGKTAILELGICRLVSGFNSDQFKIVYMAPTKSLCTERQRDWQAKFASLDLQVAELTGDTDQAQLRNVQNASIIVTTPEKWDSMTRKWKDHSRLMQLVKLFLIDEVHILKETRGATLEAVVSRMKSVGSNVRFIALSATVPNSEDIATWLGKDSSHQHIPAQRERFGEDFRPVKLQKFVYGLPSTGNDFAFDKVCDPKLPDIIAKHSHKKPMMIFCFTRKSTATTAKLLANIWVSKAPRDRLWPGPTRRIAVSDPDLEDAISSGVAFHHAGLDGVDRHAVEKGFLEGQISVICCTSTLAVGVNLPCHLVIIKNTVSYQGEGTKEYADLEMMQMMGRAGRPQFDSSAIAVIITRQEKVKKYEKLISGQELLESCLHLNLIDHLNAEIGLGTVYDVHSAKRWLAGTFLYVRLGQNPSHYKLDGDTAGQSLDDRIEQICRKDISQLQNAQLVSVEGKLESTELGDAMARYYIKFKTMERIVRLEPRSKMSEILSTLAQAEEFNEVRLRPGEKKLYQEINRANGIKFPINVDIALPAHKRTLILQAELNGVEFPLDEQFMKHKKQYQQDKVILFSHVHRLIRCVVDCQLHLQDATAVRHALELARSFAARVWDTSPLQMKQIAQIGLVGVRKLVCGGINGIEALEATEAHRIEMLMSRNPPFGNETLSRLKDFPKLFVTLKSTGKDAKNGPTVKVKIKADCGFLNEKAPVMFQRKPIFVCFLMERSDGVLVDFRRVSAKKLGKAQEMFVTAEMANYTQYFTCYVMCDEIAGTMRSAELKINLPASMFPQPRPQLRESQAVDRNVPDKHDKPINGLLKSDFRTASQLLEDDFHDDIDDQDMMEALDGTEFNHVDTYERRMTSNTSKSNVSSTPQTTSAIENDHSWEPTQLENGKWACNHKCKDKLRCKHLCCHEGVDKAPKPPKKPAAIADSSGPTQTRFEPGHQLSITPAGKSKPQKGKQFQQRSTQDVETIDLTKESHRKEYAKSGPREFRKLHRLHESVNKAPPAQVIAKTKPTFSYGKGDHPHLSFLSKTSDAGNPMGEVSSDYDDSWMDDLPSPSVLLGEKSRPQQDLSPDPFGVSTPKDDDIWDLEESMVGLGDSIALSEDTGFLFTDPISLNFDSNADFIPFDNQDDHNELPLNPIYPSNTFSSRNKENRLFLSTDSPEKPSTQNRKRRTTSPPLELPSSPPASKKQKATISETSYIPARKELENRAILSSADKENQPVTSAALSKLRPWADMEGIDPDFIAEFADFVDFV
ncbi:Sec63 [Toensbergia leucococca]|nr:Sec63 [Toensbergia leucococca]